MQKVLVEEDDCEKLVVNLFDKLWNSFDLREDVEEGQIFDVDDAKNEVRHKVNSARVRSFDQQII